MLRKKADQESDKNSTLVNTTTESGFMSSFHIEPLTEVFPATVIELPNNKDNNQEEDLKTPAKSNPLNTKADGVLNFPFNNVRTIKVNVAHYL